MTESKTFTDLKEIVDWLKRECGEPDADRTEVRDHADGTGWLPLEDAYKTYRNILASGTAGLAAFFDHTVLEIRRRPEKEKETRNMAETELVTMYRLLSKATGARLTRKAVRNATGYLLCTDKPDIGDLARITGMDDDQCGKLIAAVTFGRHLPPVVKQSRQPAPDSVDDPFED